MIKNVLEHIGGVGAYGAISICLFFTVFLGALFFALRMKKSEADSLSVLPLDDAAPMQESKAASGNDSDRASDNAFLSLTPGFSRVSHEPGKENGFNRFSPSTETKPLKRLGSSLADSTGAEARR